MNTEVTGYLLALGTAFCWAQNSLGYSFAGKRVTSHTVTHIRLWIALPLLIIVHLYFCRSFFPSFYEFDGFWLLALSGFTGFFITDICLFKTFVDIGPREGMVIMALSPILGVLFAWLFIGEELSMLQFAGVIITIGGVAWVILEEKNNEVKNPKLISGLIAGITAAVMQAISLVLAKKGMNAASFSQSVSGNFIRVIFGLAGLTVFSILRRNFIKDFKRMKDIKALSVIAVSAFIGPVIGMILGLYSLTLGKVGIITTLMQLTPVILIPFEIFVMKKKLGIGAVLGTLMAVGGAAMFFLLV